MNKRTNYLSTIFIILISLCLPSITIPAKADTCFVAQIQVHWFYKNYDPYIIFSKPDSFTLKIESTTQSIGAGWLFFTFPRFWLNGKTITVKWKGDFSYSGFPAYIWVLDGEYVRGTLDFKYYPDFLYKGNGILFEYFRQGSFNWITQSFQVNTLNGSSYMCTVLIGLIDAWIEQYGSLYIDTFSVSNSTHTLYLRTLDENIVWESGIGGLWTTGFIGAKQAPDLSSQPRLYDGILPITFSFDVSSKPAWLTESGIIDAIQNSIFEWNWHSPSAIFFSSTVLTHNDPNPYNPNVNPNDNINEICFEPLPIEYGAYAYPKYQTIDGKIYIIGGDIVINSNTFWTTGIDFSLFDLQGVITHELGHILGLPDLLIPLYAGNTMCYWTIWFPTLRTIEAYDIEMLQKLYGEPSPRTTMFIYPTADAYMRFGSPNTNFGSYDCLLTGYYDYVFVIKFPLNGIPEGATIINASLHLYKYGHYVQSLYDTQVRKIGDSWSESSITWNNKPPEGDIVATFTPNSQDNTERIVSSSGLLSYVKAEILGDKVISFYFRPAIIQYYLYGEAYYSEEYNGQPMSPYLEIIYEN